MAFACTVIPSSTEKHFVIPGARMPAVLAARLVHMSLVFQTRKLQLGWLAMQSEGGAETRENLCAELLYRLLGT